MVLKELGKRLINIHSQHETLTLNRPHFQIAVLDDFADNSSLMTEYTQAFKDYSEKKLLLKSLKDKDKSARAEQDYYRFLFDELEKAQLQEGEKEDLEKEMKQLTHAEDIREALFQGAEGLLRSDVNALDLLQGIEKKLDDILVFYPEAESLAERLKSSRIELEDIASELEKMEESVEYDPSRIEYLNERLNLIYSLEQKHHVEGTDELIKLQHEYDNKLQELDNMDYELEKLEKQVVQAESIVQKHANKLHARRKNVAPQMTTAVEEVLKKLNMPEATVEINLEKSELFNERGCSIVEILFSANKGQNTGPVNKIASGGELSRLMLSIKSILSGKNILPTIIFDEIDTGVSGNAAVKMGEIMATMSKRMQVITITHLPQIAARGDQHFKVFKFEKNNRTQTDIQILSKEERIKETALMISGESNHKEAMDTAKQLIRS
jgi:DNA repair protein RecN (Recombination protein N)